MESLLGMKFNWLAMFLFVVHPRAISLGQQQTNSLRVRSSFDLSMWSDFSVFSPHGNPCLSLVLLCKTNLSRSISLTCMDEKGNELPLRTDVDHLSKNIPPDRLLIISVMSLVNVTVYQRFHWHYLDLNETSSSSSASDGHVSLLRIHLLI